MRSYARDRFDPWMPGRRCMTPRWEGRPMNRRPQGQSAQCEVDEVLAFRFYRRQNAGAPVVCTRPVLELVECMSPTGPSRFALARRTARSHLAPHAALPVRPVPVHRPGDSRAVVPPREVSVEMAAAEPGIVRAARTSNSDRSARPRSAAAALASWDAHVPGSPHRLKKTIER